MVQMIPSTYRMVRSWHPNVPLIPDFVEGMRNHVNATEAMLLYMQRTWTDLVASPTVADAFSSGVASQDQLMAADTIRTRRRSQVISTAAAIVGRA
jgi:hypothetical protein